MDDIFVKWNKIPEIIRWVLCWPCIIIAAVIAGYIASFMWGYWDNSELSADGTPNSLSGLMTVLLKSGAGISCLFYLILQLVPRAQDIVSAILAIVLVIFAALSAVATILAIYHGEIGVFKMIGLEIEFIFVGIISVMWAVFNRHEVIKNKKDFTHPA